MRLNSHYAYCFYSFFPPGLAVTYTCLAVCCSLEAVTYFVSLKPLPVLFLSYFVLFCPSCSVNSTCLMQLYLTVLPQAVFHLSFPGFQILNLFLLLAPFFFYSLEHVIREPLPLTSNKLLKTSSTAILQSSSIKKFNLYFCWHIYLSLTIPQIILQIAGLNNEQCMLFLGTDSWATFCVQHCKFGQLWKKDGFCSSRPTYSISWLCSCKIQDNKWTAVRKVFFKFSLISWHIFFLQKSLKTSKVVKQLWSLSTDH